MGSWTWFAISPPTLLFFNPKSDSCSLSSRAHIDTLRSARGNKPLSSPSWKIEYADLWHLWFSTIWEDNLGLFQLCSLWPLTMTTYIKGELGWGNWSILRDQKSLPILMCCLYIIHIIHIVWYLSYLYLMLLPKWDLPMTSWCDVIMQIILFHVLLINII